VQTAELGSRYDGPDLDGLDYSDPATIAMMTGMAAEKMHGSVWQFTSVGGNEQSRILFHEPHPRGKLAFVVARRYGRRLNRRYGWERDTFKLK
jgi:hypothetical protein